MAAAISWVFHRYRQAMPLKRDAVRAITPRRTVIPLPSADPTTPPRSGAPRDHWLSVKRTLDCTGPSLAPLKLHLPPDDEYAILA